MQVVATRLPPISCPSCRLDDRPSVRHVTDVRGAVRHAGHSRSEPVGYPGRRMIEHDCNPAARKAGYPAGEESDPYPPALEQGAGRDLTRQSCLAAAATPRGFNRAGVGLMAGYGLASALAHSAPMRLAGVSAIGAKPRAPAASRSQNVTDRGPCPVFKQAFRCRPDAQIG